MIRRAIARRPIAAFLILGNGVYLVVLLTPPVGPELPWFDVPVHAIVGGMLGVGLAAIVVTAAADGRRGVADLVARSSAGASRCAGMRSRCSASCLPASR